MKKMKVKSAWLKMDSSRGDEKAALNQMEARSDTRKAFQGIRDLGKPKAPAGPSKPAFGK